MFPSHFIVLVGIVTRLQVKLDSQVVQAMKLVEHSNSHWINTRLSERFYTGNCQLAVFFRGQANDTN